MIAVALSGGVDSAAAAIVLRESGHEVMGITLSFGHELPSAASLERAASVCMRLGMEHHVMDARTEFESVKGYFCADYLGGNTPNPCVICNRDIKFGLLLRRVRELGADMVATGHYSRKISLPDGRFSLAPAREKNSQEYFLGLLSQDQLSRSVFPLEDMTKQEVRSLATDAGIAIPRCESSQDVCFIGEEGYTGFIASCAGYRPEPGDILDTSARKIARHKGALSYTIGQRKGLGVGFGRRVFVLATDMQKNTITVGDLDEWPYEGFHIKSVNWMKARGLEVKARARVKVRYRQAAKDSFLIQDRAGGLSVRYEGLFSPGQLAVAYDDDGVVLCAGIIDAPIDRIPG